MVDGPIQDPKQPGAHDAREGDPSPAPDRTDPFYGWTSTENGLFVPPPDFTAGPVSNGTTGEVEHDPIAAIRAEFGLARGSAIEDPEMAYLLLARVPSEIRETCEVYNLGETVDGRHAVMLTFALDRSASFIPNADVIHGEESSGLSGDRGSRVRVQTLTEVDYTGKSDKFERERLPVPVSLIAIERDRNSPVYDFEFRYQGTRIPSTVLQTLSKSIHSQIAGGSNPDYAGDGTSAERDERRLLELLKRGTNPEARTPPVVPIREQEPEVASHARYLLDRVVRRDIESCERAIGDTTIPTYHSCKVIGPGRVEVSFELPRYTATQPVEMRALEARFFIDTATGLLRAEKVARPDL